MKYRALLGAFAAIVLASCGEAGDLSGSGAVPDCAAEDQSGQCQLRRLVTDSLTNYVAGAPQSLETEHVWSMRSREEYTAQFDLIGGEDYVLIGACDRECLDIDLFLRDANGEQVVDAEGNPLQDLLLDRMPVISFTAPEDGTYQVALSMLDCLIEPCYAGLRAMRLILDPDAEPRFDARLSSGFDDPASFVLEAGGDRAWTSGTETACRGHFNAAPDVGVTYTSDDGGFPLVISAGPADPAVSPMAADYDTTLMVFAYDAGVWLCDDDSGVGQNPSVTIPRPSGRYAIWVGSYLPDARPQTRLLVSEHISQ